MRLNDHHDVCDTLAARFPPSSPDNTLGIVAKTHSLVAHIYMALSKIT